MKFLAGGRAARDPRAHRRADRRPRVLRRRPGEGRQRRAGRAARQGRPRARLRRSRAGARCGSSTSRCSSTTTKQAPGRRGTIRSPRRRTSTWSSSPPTPASALAKAYDVVLNGWEIGGGSVRIHRPEVQAKVFEALRHQPRGPAAQIRLPARRAVLRRAAARRHRLRPRPHRRRMMAGAESIRDVIAFPKTQRGQDLMVDAPTPVTEQQLRDLHIQRATARTRSKPEALSVARSGRERSHPAGDACVHWPHGLARDCPCALARRPSVAAPAIAPGDAAALRAQRRTASAAIARRPCPRRRARLLARDPRTAAPFPLRARRRHLRQPRTLLPAEAARLLSRVHGAARRARKSRGARRIVCGGAPTAPDACCYTDDHYSSFTRIRE